MADHESELELELEHEFHEGELESESEAGMEGEGWLGAIGNVVGSLLGESELESEAELESELESGELESESELEAGELESEFEGAGEFESEHEHESEFEHEHELSGEFEHEFETEQFFGKIGKFFKKAAPFLKKIAKVAAPIVGTAIGGPFGAVLGKVASSALGEHELGELESEFEHEHEFEHESEGEQEMAHEITSHELTHNEALAEVMAEAACREVHEGEAEAMVGAAAATIISARDRRALRRVLPHMVRGTAILTRILRRRRITRPLVRVVPTIVRRTIKDLKRQAANGAPITRRRLARAAAKQVRKVLGSPRACAAAVKRNIRVSRAYKRPRRTGMSAGSARRRRSMR
jgi:hypothetical protein